MRAELKMPFLGIPLEGDAEVVCRAVDRCPHVLYEPAVAALRDSLEDIESAHADMTVRGKVECAVIADERKEFVAAGVDISAEVFRA